MTVPVNLLPAQITRQTPAFVALDLIAAIALHVLLLTMGTESFACLGHGFVGAVFGVLSKGLFLTILFARLFFVVDIIA